MSRGKAQPPSTFIGVGGFIEKPSPALDGQRSTN